MAAILHALQMGNWQRGGGKGTKPKPIKRPKDAARSVPTLDEFAAKKKALADELERRRQRKQEVSGGN